MQAALRRFLDGDLWHGFRTSPMAIAAATIALICVIGAGFAPWLAPYPPNRIDRSLTGEALAPGNHYPARWCWVVKGKVTQDILGAGGAGH